MARPSNAQRKMAKLYVYPGPFQGQWEACAKEAGMEEVPAKDDSMLHMLIGKLGGKIEEEAEPDAISALMNAKELGIPWTELREKLSTVIQNVASGEQKASAAQVSMIKEVIKEAKEMVAGSGEQIQRVVLLPTEGENATLELDRGWRERIKALEAPPDA